MLSKEHSQRYKGSRQIEVMTYKETWSVSMCKFEVDEVVVAAAAAAAAAAVVQIKWTQVVDLYV